MKVAVLALVVALIGAAWAAAAPLDLAACVHRALAQNPQVEDARDASAAAYLARTVALDEFTLKAVPTVNGGLQGGNRTNQSYQMLFNRKFLATGTEFSVTGGTSVFSSVPQVSVPYFTETRASLAQPLWRGRSQLENRDRVDDAERRISSSQNALETAREDLALQVVHAFYEVVRADELVQVAEKSLARMAELDKMAQAKLTLGSVSKMDVFRTQIHSGRIQNALLEQRARRSASLDGLKALLGVDPRVELEIDSRLQGPAPADVAGEDPADVALDRRIEVRESREGIADAERKLLLARDRIWPGVDLVGSYALQGLGTSFGDSTRLDRNEWGVGLRSTFPLDRTVEQAAAAEAEIALRGRERRYQVTRSEVVRQVREAVRQLARVKAEVALAGGIAEQADQQAELARFRYEKGVTDNFDLIQAEEQRAEAKSGYAQAAIEEALAAASLRRATATLVDAFRVSPSGSPTLPKPAEDGGCATE